MKPVLPPSLARPARIQLLAHDNGFGLSRDLNLLAQALREYGCEVDTRRLQQDDEVERWRLGRGWPARRCGWQHRWAQLRGGQRYDLNIMFEHLWPSYWGDAQRSIALPNPEWFDAKDQRHLRFTDGVWAKTRQTQQLFETPGRPVHFLGFSSEDRYEPEVPREHGYFHLAGGSPRKGTARLLQLWRQHPHWPRLTVVQRQPLEGSPAANIEVHSGYLDDQQLRRLQNRNRIHLCPSEAEGYGHYLVEAMSVGAVVVTCQSAPMNELVTAERGRLIPVQPGPMLGMVPASSFDSAELAAIIEDLNQHSTHRLDEMGQHGRRWFETNQAGFRQRVGAGLAQLGLLTV